MVPYQIQDIDRRDRPRRLWLLYLAGLIVALLLYLLSVAPGVLWQDSGYAQIRTLRGDIYGDLGLALSHPLYYLVAFAFQYLPFAESAFKTNLVSVLFGAITVANILLLLRLLTKRLESAVIGTISLAIAHTFWQHCALAEVYTLSTALLSAELLCLMQHTRTGRTKWLVALFLLNGLGISNHMLASLSLVCYVLLVIWLLIKGKLHLPVLPLLGLAWLAGASIYLIMIIAQIAAGQGVGETISSALFGRSYAPNVLNIHIGARQLINSVLCLGMNFPTPAALLVFPALATICTGKLKPVKVMLVMLLAVHLAWAVRYDVPDQYTFFIPSLVFLAVMIGLGANWFLLRHSRRWTYCLMALALLPAAVYVPLPGIARTMKLNFGVSREIPYRDEYAYFLHPWKTGYRGAWKFAQELRDTLPSGAVLIADGTIVRPVHYLQLTGRWPEDIEVFPPIVWDDTTRTRFKEDGLTDKLSAGLVFVVSPTPGYCPKWLLKRYTFDKFGIVYRVISPQIREPASEVPTH